jgi:hypothetical protein
MPGRPGGCRPVPPVSASLGAAHCAPVCARKASTAQAGDRGQAGQLHVGHALGDQQRGEHDSRDDVLGQPPALVGHDDADPGHQAGQEPDAPAFLLRVSRCLAVRMSGRSRSLHSAP